MTSRPAHAATQGIHVPAEFRSVYEWIFASHPRQLALQLYTYAITFELRQKLTHGIYNSSLARQ